MALDRPAVGQIATVRVRGQTLEGQFLDVAQTDTGWAGVLFVRSTSFPFVLHEDLVEAITLGAIYAVPTTLVRTYIGKQQHDVAPQFSRDVNVLASLGYEPSSQSWAPGQWGCGAWLAALVLCVVLIGILIFIYMLIVRPDGTLTVTYTRKAAPGSVAPALPPQAPAAASLAQRLREVQEARDAGLLTDEEYQRKRSEVIESG